MEEEPAKTGPKDVFGHLLSVVFLYMLVFSIGGLIFTLIDAFVPDVLDNYSYNYRYALRWPLSVTIVVFPVFLYITSYLSRDLERHPEKRSLKTRRWLLYFTLFAAALVVVGDLISVIFQFLGGDLSLRFILKSISVLVMAGAVATYYLWNLRRETPACRDPRMKLFIWAVVAFVIALVISGFVLAGSPLMVREQRIDSQRVTDLQVIQFRVVDYWQAKGELPENLDVLRDDIQGFVPPLDPVTRESYEYRTTGELSFELCAVFDAVTGDEKVVDVRAPGIASDSWEHGEGRTCFSRTIDPDIFPPRKIQ